jgi:hypothetical protein
VRERRLGHDERVGGGRDAVAGAWRAGGGRGTTRGRAEAGARWAGGARGRRLGRQSLGAAGGR